MGLGDGDRGFGVVEGGLDYGLTVFVGKGESRLIFMFRHQDRPSLSGLSLRSSWGGDGCMVWTLRMGSGGTVEPDGSLTQ
jgi:hypothetical protein